MTSNSKNDEIIKNKISKDIDSGVVPEGLKDDIWKQIQSRKPKKRFPRILPYLAMAACLALLIPLIIYQVQVYNNSTGSEVMKKEDVKAFVKEYKTEQYTIENPSNPPTGLEIGEKVKAFLSDEELENLMRNTVFSVAPTVAKNTNKSIQLEEVILEKEEENDNGSIDYKYTLKLKFYDGKSSKVVDKKGELTIINTDDGLKITRDWESLTEFEKENSIKHN